MSVNQVCGDAPRPRRAPEGLGSCGGCRRHLPSHPHINRYGFIGTTAGPNSKSNNDFNAFSISPTTNNTNCANAYGRLNTAAIDLKNAGMTLNISEPETTTSRNDENADEIPSKASITTAKSLFISGGRFNITCTKYDA